MKLQVPERSKKNGMDLCFYRLGFGNFRSYRSKTFQPEEKSDKSGALCLRFCAFIFISIFFPDVSGHEHCLRHLDGTGNSWRRYCQHDFLRRKPKTVTNRQRRFNYCRRCRPENRFLKYVIRKTQNFVFSLFC